jgi:C1A family cysteine protease
MVQPVKDQGTCGSCWAFSATGALEAQWFKTSNKQINISEQNLVDCTYASTRDGCQGGWPTDSFMYMINGVENSTTYPVILT